MLYPNFLAPIDDYTDLPFRLLCQKYGAKATCVPLVNSTAISRKPEKLDEINTQSDECNLGIQLVGNNPADIGKTSELITENLPHVKWLNLNCGCPSNRTRGSGGGAALLDHPGVISKSILEMTKHHDDVSVKMRLKPDLGETIELCKKIQKAGARFIIIHGRTAKQGYSGKANWDAIKSVKDSLDTPIVGNGDIKDAKHGRQLVKEGYCDSFMIGREAMSNPMVFSDKVPDLKEKKALFGEYMKLAERYDKCIEIGILRLKAINFMTGVPNAAQLRDDICRVKTVENIVELIENY